MQKYTVNTSIIGDIYSETLYSIKVMERKHWNTIAQLMGRQLDESIEHLRSIDTQYWIVLEWTGGANADRAELANNILEQIERNGLYTERHTPINLWNVWPATN
ncbi:MAG: hypothetical protein DRI46_08080 [Chloroflexi bacterium]|nr:MAG: hypothetical protein DRI46_08080 [Chloroflexota bacterium]